METGHTSFALAYGSEAMVPVELVVPSHRRQNSNQKQNEQLLLESLDIVGEKRKEAELRNAAHQKSVARYLTPKYTIKPLKWEILYLGGLPVL